MLLKVNERIRKVDSTPTIQCRVSDEIFKQFSKIAEHFNCYNAELLRALIDNSVKNHQEVI